MSSLVNETNYYFFLQNQTANKNVWNIKSNDVQSPFWPQLLLKNNWMNWWCLHFIWPATVSDSTVPSWLKFNHLSTWWKSGWAGGRNVTDNSRVRVRALCASCVACVVTASDPVQEESCLWLQVSATVWITNHGDVTHQSQAGLDTSCNVMGKRIQRVEQALVWCKLLWYHVMPVELWFTQRAASLPCQGSLCGLPPLRMD